MLVLCILNLIFSANTFALDPSIANPSLEAARTHPYSIVLAIYAFVFMFFVTGLLSYHTFLVFTNQTTNENLKGSFDGLPRSPFYKGCLGNMK